MINYFLFCEQRPERPESSLYFLSWVNKINSFRLQESGSFLIKFVYFDHLI